MARYIDADLTVRAICGKKCGCERSECGHDIPCQQVQMLEISPTADVVERKKGEWILQEDKTQKHYGWHFCSECGAWIGEPTNFCSECGADMRGNNNDN